MSAPVTLPLLLTPLTRSHSMRLILGHTVAETSAALAAQRFLTNLYAQGKTLGRAQCMWWD